MEINKRSSWLLLLLGFTFVATTLQGVGAQQEGPSESECRPYIEKALKELETGDEASATEATSQEQTESAEDVQPELAIDDPNHDDKSDGDDDSRQDEGTEGTETTETETVQAESDETKEVGDDNKSEEAADATTESDEAQATITEADSKEDAADKDSKESADDAEQPSAEDKEGDKDDSQEKKDESGEATDKNVEEDDSKPDDSKENEADSKQDDDKDDDSKQEKGDDSKEGDSGEKDKDDASTESVEKEVHVDAVDAQNKSDEADSVASAETKEDSKEEDNKSEENKDNDDGSKSAEDNKDDGKSGESKEQADNPQNKEDNKDDKDSKEDDVDSKEENKDTEEDTNDGDSEEAPVEELTQEIEVPSELRPREHVEELLKLDDESSEQEKIINRISDITLKELKKLHENAIKPLEVLYKYRDLSNRHFGDSEIFSKPLVLFMGPWSGGKSSIINYLLDNEYNETALRTGAEPSPAYFNILLHGDEYEVLDGTQLAADFTFSGLQKFGQGLEERLRGVKLPSKLLEKINIVEIPGILEVRKQVSRLFPFNDACQWFIDRADIIFLVYDPSKLDVGPETEAILDQLKGREQQTRIILNKADRVKPEELMRVQSALIWNISPLMSSAQPPVMYTTSLWSRPYEGWAPGRLLLAQERAFLRDLGSAIDKRIEHKISSARRFAVRVRNHAKMVDCYLTTYYNHKSVFGNRKQVADAIIERPQDYHIYEGLSTLTNISRYDLPDPDVYKDFFKLNPLYEFQQLSATCTYFRGCPINRLDVAIAYDLPELVGKHKRLIESALAEASTQTAPGS